MKINFRNLVGRKKPLQLDNDALSPYSSIEEVLVAATVYELQEKSPKGPALESVVCAVPGMSPNDVAARLPVLEQKGLLSLVADESRRQRYTISPNNGIISHRIIEHNPEAFQKYLDRHRGITT